MLVPLKGLMPEAKYTIRTEDHSTPEKTYSGAQLMNSGLMIASTGEIHERFDLRGASALSERLAPSQESGRGGTASCLMPQAKYDEYNPVSENLALTGRIQSFASRRSDST